MAWDDGFYTIRKWDSEELVNLHLPHCKVRNITAERKSSKWNNDGDEDSERRTKKRKRSEERETQTYFLTSIGSNPGPRKITHEDKEVIQRRARDCSAKLFTEEKELQRCQVSLKMVHMKIEFQCEKKGGLRKINNVIHFVFYC